MSGFFESNAQAPPAPAPAAPESRLVQPPSAAASSPVQKAPDWRVPVVVVALVVAIALAGYFIAVSRISPTKPIPAPTPAAGAGGLVKISEWPAGLGGWTVVLSQTHSEAVADASATRLADEGVAAGVIDSSQHPGWVPGYWVVFSGRYLTQQTAKAAAQSLAAGSHQGAYAKLVQRAS